MAVLSMAFRNSQSQFTVPFWRAVHLSFSEQTLYNFGLRWAFLANLGCRCSDKPILPEFSIWILLQTKSVGFGSDHGWSSAKRGSCSLLTYLRILLDQKS